MKPKTKILVAIFGVLIVLSSCTKDDTINQVIQDEQPELVQNGQIIDGQYIVVFHKEVEPVLKGAMSFQEKKSSF